MTFKNISTMYNYQIQMQMGITEIHHCPNNKHAPYTGNLNIGASNMSEWVRHGESKFSLSDTGILTVKYRALQDKSNNKPKVVCLLSTDHENAVAA